MFLSHIGVSLSLTLALPLSLSPFLSSKINKKPKQDHVLR